MVAATLQEIHIKATVDLSNLTLAHK